MFTYPDSVAGHDAMAQKQLLDVLAKGSLQVARVEVTSAQILALSTTPKTLIPAPGAGKGIIVDGMVVVNLFNTTAYAFNASGLVAKYTDGSGTAVTGVVAEAFGEATADAIARALPVGVTVTQNAPVVLHAPTADPTTGNGTFVVYIAYRVADLALV